MAEGKLCVSVIEARNVLADTEEELNFYVRLRMGHAEVKTDVARNSASPKFLKDVRMGVADPDADVLRMELLQCGPRGDLVVGSDELQVSSIVNQGTVVHWFELTSFDEEVTAELCLVLRYLQAGGNRSMTPSYAIAAREAKQRALDSSQADDSMQQPSKAIFTDLQGKDQAEAGGAPTAAAATATPPGSAMAPNTPARSVSSPFVREPEQQTGAPGTAGGVDAAGVVIAAEEVEAEKPRRSLVARLSELHVPLPLALLGGALIGAAVYLVKAKLGSEGSEGQDVLSTPLSPAPSPSKPKSSKGGKAASSSGVDAMLQPGLKLRIPKK
mmetsp:Transcript_27326/g.69546  ORF Transcript_27326/g.69546 Transcript_27326/m.69546 type:complete len:328 (-) Transcript_27326:98-1081(-)